MESLSPFSSYFRICRKILLDPGYFFREEFHRLKLSSALALGLASAWISMVVLFFFSTLSSLAIERIFRGWVEDFMEFADFGTTASEAARAFLVQAGFLVVYPFFLLWYLSGFAAVLLLFSKVFIQDQSQLSYQNCLKILGLSLCSSWFVLIPIFGELIAFVAFLILLVVGIREVFWVSTQRAALIVFAPQALFAVFFLLLLGLMAVLSLIWINGILMQSGMFSRGF